MTGKRVATYARFSSNQQREESEKEQFRLWYKTEMIWVPNGCPKTVSEELFDKV